MKKLPGVSLVLLSWIIVHLRTQVHAASAWGSSCLPTEVTLANGQKMQIEGVATIQCLVPLFRNIVVAVVQLSGVALLLMFIVGGYQFLMSGGNPKQLEQARGTLTYAIIGVVVIVCAYLIIRLVQAFTGVDVSRFTIPE